MTRRTGHEGLHTRVVQDKRDAETLREVAAEIRAARVARTVEHLNTHWRGTLDALAQFESREPVLWWGFGNAVQATWRREPLPKNDRGVTYTVMPAGPAFSTDGKTWEAPCPQP